MMLRMWGFNTEDFLEDDQSGAGLAGRAGNVGAHRGAVIDREVDEFSFDVHGTADYIIGVF